MTTAAVEDLVQGFMFGPYPDDPYPSYDALRETARQYMQVIEFQAEKHFEALMRVEGL